MDAATHPWNLSIATASDGTLEMRLSGSWRSLDRPPSLENLRQRLPPDASARRIRFNTDEVSAWDSGLVIFVRHVIEIGQSSAMEVDRGALPEGVRRLLELASAVPAQKDTGRHGEIPPLITRVGLATQAVLREFPEMLRFVGEATIAIGRLLRGKAQFRRSDLYLVIQQVGPDALPIVSLISFLVGVILAYMGAMQLAQFGAQIFIADLVGIGMVREIGALMTGVIVAGRTGAAFAAELGTMQVNEEIDAFKTLGISPMEFLVLPRLLALTLMMPLLTLYSGIVGVFAGLFVCSITFDIGVFEYFHQTMRALDLRQFLIGMLKGTVYGILVALAGCLRGIQCGRSAQAVGEATTSAVVTAILFIVIAASALTIMFQKLNI